jgi:hypothetical protein
MKNLIRSINVPDVISVENLESRFKYQGADLAKLDFHEIEKAIKLRLENLNGLKYLSIFIYSDIKEAKLLLRWLNALRYDAFETIGPFLDQE